MSERPLWQKVAAVVLVASTMGFLTSCGGSGETQAPEVPPATGQTTDFCSWLVDLTKSEAVEVERLALLVQCQQYLGATEIIDQGIPDLPPPANESQILLMNQEALDPYFSETVIKVIEMAIEGYKSYRTIIGAASWEEEGGVVENSQGEIQAATVLAYYDDAAREISLEFTMPEVWPSGEFVIGNSCRTLISEQDGSVVVDIFVPNEVKMDNFEVQAVVEASLSVAREINPEGEITVRLSPFLQTVAIKDGQRHVDYTASPVHEWLITDERTRTFFGNYDVPVEVFVAHSELTEINRFELDQVLLDRGAKARTDFIFVTAPEFSPYDLNEAQNAVREYTLR